MADDLYQNDVNVVEKSGSSSEAVSGSNNSFSDFFSDLINFDFNVDLGDWLLKINYFALAWGLFYTVIFLLDFWYYRLRLSGEISRYKKGEKALKNGITMWISYMLCLALFFTYTKLDGWAETFIGIAALASYLIKFLFIDLQRVPVIENAMNDDSTWFGKFVNGISTGIEKTKEVFFSIFKKSGGED